MSTSRSCFKKSETPDVKLSKSMTFILRHGAEKEKFIISQGNFDLLFNSKDFFMLKKKYNEISKTDSSKWTIC
jgi:hypothetical protein